MIIEAGGSHGPVVFNDRRKLFVMTAVGAATLAVVSLSYHKYMPRRQRPVTGDGLVFLVCFRSYVSLFAPLELSVWLFVHRLGHLYLLPCSNSCLAIVYTIILLEVI